MILGSLFQRHSTTAQGNNNPPDRGEEPSNSDELLALMEKAGREFMRRAAAPSTGWIASSSATDFFAKYAESLRGVKETEPYPEILTSLADEVGRSTEPDLERLAEIAAHNIGASISFCDFYESLRPPSKAILSQKTQNLLRDAWRINCPVIHAEPGETSMLIGCVNPLLANEARKHFSRQQYAPLISAMRLGRTQWSNAMQSAKALFAAGT